MVYSALRGAAIRLLRLPAGPPDPPPGGKVVRTFNASPRYLHYCLLAVWVGSGIVFAIAGVMAVFAATQGGGWSIAAAVFAFLGLVAASFGYVATRLEFEMRFYILTDRSLRIREGVLFLRESTLTFANVQNLRIKRGPLQQIFGISDVLVDTAGGAGGTKDVEGQAMKQGHRGTIMGIENPAEIRNLVMDLLRRYRDAGLGDPDDHAHGTKHHAEDAEMWREILAEVKALRKVMLTK